MALVGYGYSSQSQSFPDILGWTLWSCLCHIPIIYRGLHDVKSSFTQKFPEKFFHTERFNMNEVYILEIYDPDDDSGQSPILGVFNSKESAEVYRNEYIRDRYSIEEDFSDQDLHDEIVGIEFHINRFRIMA